MTALDRTLVDVRRRIDRAGSKGLNEQNTRATLVEPVLSALGWDVHDVEEVAREFKLKSRDKPVDYALLVMREPRLFVEAKALGGNLDDRRWANQIMGYAAVAGVEWIVLTNGDEYRLYNAGATVPVEEKLLRTVNISKDVGDAEEILGLISKDQLRTNRIGALWKAHFVDRRVRAAVERFFSADQDMALVNHVRAIATDLTPEDIRASMRRCKLTLDFPLSPDDLAAANVRRPARKSSKPTWKAEFGQEVTLLHLIQAGLLRAPSKLVRHYQGQDLEARLLADGNIEFRGKTFSSSSLAGSAARATVTGLREDGSMRATNGWKFWKCKGTDGQLVLLDELRQRYVIDSGGAAAKEA